MGFYPPCNGPRICIKFECTSKTLQNRWKEIKPTRDLKLRLKNDPNHGTTPKTKI